MRRIASSDARVTTEQNDYTIYQIYVSSGPFKAKDLSQVAAGLDLRATVREADGNEHSFI